MGEPERQIKSRPLPSQLQIYERQEAIIGASIMCLSTISAQFLVQTMYSWQMGKTRVEFPSQNICSPQLFDQREAMVGLLSFVIVALASYLWVLGLEIYFRGFEKKGRRDIAARNKGLIYGFGAVNVSLVMTIIWPGINEMTSFAIKVLLAYMGMVIGNL